MKKLLLLCVLSIACSALFAQATDLVVDCQTPGWLSSKINYGDQQTVKNLKVTGYVNATDLRFIGSLISSRNLDGRLDLSECNIVKDTSEGEDNYLGNYLAPSQQRNLQALLIPKSATRVEGCTGRYLYVDSLYFDCQMNTVSQNCFGGKYTKLGHVVIGECVNTIPKEAFCRTPGTGSEVELKSIHLPSTIISIGDDAFSMSGLESCNFNDLVNLESLGRTQYNAAYNFAEYRTFGSCTPDTIIVPAKLDTYPLTAFFYKEGVHIYITEATKTLIGGVSSKYTFKQSGEGITFHIKQSTPPEITYWFQYAKWFEGAIVYVPKGAKSAYDISNWSSCTIIEEKTVETLTLSKHQITLNKEEQYTLSVSVTPQDADDKTIEWKSGNESVATVDANGVVTAINDGETKIYATSTATGIQDSCTVLVRKNVSNVSLDESQITLSNVGDTKQLVAVVMPKDATDKSVTWKSSNEQVCIVSFSGLITATGAGTAIVTVTTEDGGHTANCVVKVLQHVTGLNFEKNSISLKVGEKEQLKIEVKPDNADNKTVTWSSSNKQIASVEANGNVTALKPGEAWIKAISVDHAEAKDSCKVTVTQPVTGITISQEAIKLTNIGENKQLEATVLPKDASNKEVKWKSSNESICMVANGKVIATGFGIAVVMVTTVEGGFMASCTVTVESENTAIESVEASVFEKPVYNMMGRKVTVLEKGRLYIRNGKKFIAK